MVEQVMDAAEAAAFDREAYIALADEFDAHGQEVAPELTDFEPSYIEGARRTAEKYGIPLPWGLRSLDLALEFLLNAERMERSALDAGDLRPFTDEEMAHRW